MADDNTIIEGTVKFRDGKKWKSRWCVMRKLSPVADCVHLQVYRDSRARCAGAASKASLSLQRFLGCEAGFTLDKHSHTLALLCQDFTAVLAFETRERLMQWQVKVSTALGEARQYLVLVGGGGSGGGARKLAAGPARLHLLERRVALTRGVPPRLLAVWDIAHLRRYGVVEGRFCFEGGSHCGKGEGLHVLVTDQAHDIARDFDLASRGQLTPRRRPLGTQSPNCTNSLRKPHVRRLELNTIDRSLPPTDLSLYEDPCIGEEAGAVSPYWPSAERTNFPDMGLGDTASVNETVDGTDMAPWNGNGNVMLERCMSCISKLGALSRSSTAALTPGAKHFSPAWTMEAVDEIHTEAVVHDTGSSNTLSDTNKNTEEVCRCSLERPPERPPKPLRLELQLTRKPPMPLPSRSFSHSHLASIGENNPTSVGPYENYDVPKIPSAEVEGEYYDTPKRLKECLNSELFKMTKSSTSNTLILKKPCGCLLKLGRKPKRPTIVDTDESFQPTSCPCRRVTDWANNWIKLPYCRRDAAEPAARDKENVTPDTARDGSALYATVDLSRKTKRKTQNDNAVFLDNQMTRSLDSSTIEVDDGPHANYENLNFALSLEHYENAKDLLRRAGVTQPELDALSANLRPTPPRTTCAECGHPREQRVPPPGGRATNDEYLLMEPSSLDSNKLEQDKALPSGYTPMSPIGSFGFHTLKHPAKSPIGRLLDEKSASNPTLCGPEEARAGASATATRVELRAGRQRAEYRKRSSSADSSRFLDDVKEFDGSVGSRGSASSIETLRDAGADEQTTAAPCDCAASKHSDADSSEASKAAGCAAAPAGNRSSSSSNDSGVSSWSLAARGEAPFELPATSAAARRRYRSARRAADSPRAPPRRSRSSGPPRAESQDTQKCCSAEAEVPILTVKPIRGVMDTHSTSSGTSDMSDYIETLSICSSHSSTDTPVTMRVLRQTTSTLRPRSGKEYQPLAPHLAARPPHPHTHTHTHTHTSTHTHTHTHSHTQPRYHNLP